MPDGTLQFNYIFMSEEYNEYVNSFNDGFLLLIDGENVAKVPGTQDVVSINTINNDVNNVFFNDNEAIPAKFNTEYDGFTTILSTAPVELFQRQSYAAKLVIADGGDSSVDSSLVIQGSSFAPHGKHNNKRGYDLVFDTTGGAHLPSSMTNCNEARNELRGERTRWLGAKACCSKYASLKENTILQAFSLTPLVASHHRCAHAWTLQGLFKPSGIVPLRSCPITFMAT